MAGKLTVATIDAFTVFIDPDTGMAKPKKHMDGDSPGLYLLVSKTGAKLFRLKYFLGGKEYVYALGQYPKVGLKKARDDARAAREQIVKGEHPIQARKDKVEADQREKARTFAVVAEDFLTLKTALNPSTLSNYRGALKNHINPKLGKLPVAKIRVSDVRAVVERMKSTAMARHSFTLIKQVLDFAEENDDVERNVLTDKRGIKPTHVSVKQKAITEPGPLREFLRKLDACEGNAPAMDALRMLVLVPARPSEMASMMWQDVDLEAATWTYTVSKTGKSHIAVLSRQAVDILQGRRDHSVTGKLGKGYVFASPKALGKPICADAILTAMVKSLGYDRGTVSAHGWRSTFRSLAHEQLGIEADVTELMLSHRLPGALSDIYMRSLLLDQRKAAAQAWGDYLDKLRANPLDQVT